MIKHRDLSEVELDAVANEVTDAALHNASEVQRERFLIGQITIMILDRLKEIGRPDPNDIFERAKAEMSMEGVMKEIGVYRMTNAVLRRDYT